MKKIIILALTLASFTVVRAQNTFPASGNVGIGTTSPAEELSVNGQLEIKATAPFITQITDNTSSSRFLRKIITSNDDLDKWYEKISTNNNLSILKAGSPNLTFVNYDFTDNYVTFPDVEVGIGTSTPRSTLDVFGNTGLTISDEAGSEYWSQQVVGAGDLHFYDNEVSGIGNEVKVTFQNGTGNVGIGTTDPQALLHIEGAGGSSDGFRINNAYNAVRGYFKGSTDNSEFLITYNNTGGAEIELQADGDVILAQSGNVGIGSTSPDSKLTVKGDIHAEEVRVDLNVPGPDYVFEADYQLSSLEDTKNYITENKHLPEIPSAAEMEADGIDLGDMNMRLLKKIEELTLHLIDQNQKLEAQNQRIESLEQEIKSLKN